MKDLRRLGYAGVAWLREGVSTMQIDRLNPGLLRALLAVADHGSISAASEAVHYSQPGLSRKLVRLERAAGAQLLRRSRRGTTLTADGQRLARVARTVIDDLSNLPTTPHDRNAPLRLRVFPTACVDLVPRALATLAHEVTDLDVRLVATRDPGAALMMDDVDLAVMVRWDLEGLEDPADTGDLEDPGPARGTDSTVRDDVENVDPAHVAVSKIRDEDLVLILPAGDDRAGRTVDDADLVGQRWIDGPHPDCLGPDHLPWPGARIGFHAPTWAAKLQAVADGRGLSLVPRSVRSTLPASIATAELRRTRRRSLHLARPQLQSRNHRHANALADALLAADGRDAPG
jgi:DNA-binding transcriptional LysR family regulator